MDERPERPAEEKLAGGKQEKAMKKKRGMKGKEERQE